MVISGLMRPFSWKVAMSSSVRPRMRSLLRAASIAVCDARRSFCAWIRIAWPGQKSGDPSRIGREHRRRAVFVDRDFAFGDVFGAEVAFGDGLNGQARPFGGARRVALQSLAGLARDFGMPGLCAADLRRA